MGLGFFFHKTLGKEDVGWGVKSLGCTACPARKNVSNSVPLGFAELWKAWLTNYRQIIKLLPQLTWTIFLTFLSSEKLT